MGNIIWEYHGCNTLASPLSNIFSDFLNAHGGAMLDCDPPEVAEPIGMCEESHRKAFKALIPRLYEQLRRIARMYQDERLNGSVEA